jgi:hypothetical protein
VLSSVGTGEAVAVGSADGCAELLVVPQAVRASVNAAIAAMAGKERCFFMLTASSMFSGCFQSHFDKPTL